LTKEDLARRVGRSRPAVSNLIRLLDLPDETLVLLESGELSEGHGRALLGADGNDDRRRLARDAVRGGWSVRETENRVKLAGQPKKGRSSRTQLAPEEAAAMRDAEDELESALGHEVKVRSRGGEIAVEIRFEDLDQALDLARSLDARRG
jgi:ParB family chromosome partitioning protein